jgi:NAD(P)-dependent dehydrogenase (short-subunit alcohol dehydrogenase family)
VRIEGKVWVVTGAGAGMGRELVLQLLSRNARVAAVDLRPETLAETAGLARAGDRLSTHVVDITDRDGVRALPEAVVDVHGVVDGVINNAGIIQPFAPVAELDHADARRVMEVNFFGTYHVVEAFLPLLLERPEAHLANVSSMGGFFPFPGQTVYGASKAAVKLLTEGLYAELRTTGVRVSAIFPGAVLTGITDNSGVTAGVPEASDSKIPMLSAEKAAGIMLNGLQKDRLHIYVGTDSRLMSAGIRVAPRPAIGLVQKLMARAAGQS